MPKVDPLPWKHLHELFYVDSLGPSQKATCGMCVSRIFNGRNVRKVLITHCQAVRKPW